MAAVFERNIPLLYGYSIFIKRVSMPIIIIYFLLNNLNFTQIGILAAVMAIASLVTEVHGGVFADKHGKKTSLMIHSVFGLLTMFFYFIGDSFTYFLVASVMYGLSSAFISGTRQSLMYDTLLKLKKEAQFKKHNSRMVLYSHVVNALVLLTIPVIYTFNTKLPFLIGIGFFVISLIIAFFFTEPEIKSRRVGLPKGRIFDSFKEISTNKVALYAFVIAMITGAFTYMSSNFIQPLLQISGLEIIYFGIVYALMRVIMGVGGEITHRLERYARVKTLVLFGVIIFLLSFAGFYIGTGIAIILAVLFLKFGEGYNRIILEDELNKGIKSENRTTILSISNLSKQLTNAILVFSFGIAADIVGVQGMFGYALIVFIVFIAFAMLFLKCRK
ncbi:MAG: MFS transporter [Candidatus Aenigmarchaeota archaeon]|nr:MFS transporter [Candidatus Aenigmarchaeota archaeon]